MVINNLITYLFCFFYGSTMPLSVGDYIENGVGTLTINVEYNNKPSKGFFIHVVNRNGVEINQNLKIEKGTFQNLEVGLYDVLVVEKDCFTVLKDIVISKNKETIININQCSKKFSRKSEIKKRGLCSCQHGDVKFIDVIKE